ncbi:hypothetical protein [Mycolicibacterium diernhoferi]|uniref:DUF3263 domain-containing protein n=1 Tax=Mycolicibacterium diernhoferi TaxID=1801 RepID=A0A1Q4HAA1_9MYCO|nr:hypothetical protein [Mycolicibacterium diernhoferi]OJZ64453.1 hypothetical protein BRW64_18500 [Mycolicibacterium diernhoferi]OPE54894.1 hypothetical protein BV510_07965 [Mycolicibacterium diernhoferi]PEG52324.1 hypothetical protein CRI78_22000 [Mycolicibacterium diernhoferi]QYL24278.1 hypothetical protein K0O62_08440 [Mycolicibacterium diernhoferi]
MDRYDREILDYVRSWSPYGGPPAAELLQEFGLTPGQLTTRVEHIIAAEKRRREQELARPWLRVTPPRARTADAKRVRARTIGA